MRLKMKKDIKIIILILFVFITIAYSKVFAPNSRPQYQNYQRQFQAWLIKNNRQYSSQYVKLYRSTIYNQNSKLIKRNNQMYISGQTNYKLKINQFADLTLQQFNQMYGNTRPKLASQTQIHQNLKPKLSSRIQKYKLNKFYRQKIPISTTQVTIKCNGIIENSPNPPQQVDWTTKAVIPPVDQGQCGSNWAFISTGALQGLYFLRKSKLIRFSQQQLIDCSQQYGNQGCRGGFMDQGFWYMIDHGVTSNELYPYKAVQSQKCNYTSSMKIAQIQRCAKVPYGNYSKLLSSIIQQPTSVAIDAQHFDFQFYDSGIYDGNCTDDVNRGMLLVGYGNDNGIHYWKLKNSLGPQWGDKGYMLIKKTQEDGPGKCGIQVAASIPQLLA